MADFARVAIIGTGLIGGSLGLALRQLDDPPVVVGHNRRRETSALAKQIGAVDVTTEHIDDVVRGADLVFVATPVGAIIETLRSVVPHLEPGTIVSDVGSTKAGIVRAAEEITPTHAQFIGGHPMAGSEREGVANASASLFVGAYYLLTPTKNTDMGAYNRLHSLLNRLGPTVLAVDPDAHDRAVAAISHVPHLISSALVNLAAAEAKSGETVLRIAAGGFKDMTRIAGGNADMWADICLTNFAAILEEIDQFSRQLDRLANAIRLGDRDSLAKVLDEARAMRSRLPSLWQKEPVPLNELHVPVLDRPGVISEITLTIGQLGINIEDIELLHASEAAGTLRLVVEKGPNLDKGIAALKSKGYDAQIIEMGEG